ncbi:hypothetical protein FRC18_003171 [Serendipita sp. 400]|nr:hypothetical protein FRC18_003171 [Serendipita sp. 400]
MYPKVYDFYQFQNINGYNYHPILLTFPIYNSLKSLVTRPSTRSAQPFQHPPRYYTFSTLTKGATKSKAMGLIILGELGFETMLNSFTAYLRPPDCWHERACNNKIQRSVENPGTIVGKIHDLGTILWFEEELSRSPRPPLRCFLHLYKPK